MPPKNGIDYLILINTGTVAVPVWTVVGCQRDHSIDENADFIDTSCKTSNKRSGLGGRYSASLSLDAVYLFDDDAYVALQNAIRSDDGDDNLVQVMQSRDGSNIEYADAIVTNISRNLPDNDVATVSMSLEITGDWTDA